jgi:hypothetical protein
LEIAVSAYAGLLVRFPSLGTFLTLVLKTQLFVHSPMLNETLTKLALRAMRRLMSHPISQPFHAPFKPDEEPPGYSAVVQRPLTLCEICTKLKEGRYSTLTAFGGIRIATAGQSPVVDGRRLHFFRQ